jgi:hypothetical protein
MTPSTFELPGPQRLRDGLNSVFSANGRLGPTLSILHRRPFIYQSTSPSEIVTCRLDAGKKLRVLCKYSAAAGTAYGHRGGAAYEAAVYQRILHPSGASVPRFYGTYEDASTGRTWLVLEYLDGCERASEVPDGLIRAARWIGRFHARTASCIPDMGTVQIICYDEQYYAGWVGRAAAFSARWRRRLPWVSDLCKGAAKFLSVLAQGPLTLIHGEYYPANVLVRHGFVYPVDWESAALAAGEIDLAALTESWDQETVVECEHAYRQARWRDGAPDDFEQRLDAARAYLCFRWLGDDPRWTTKDSGRFRKLRALATRWASWPVATSGNPRRRRLVNQTHDRAWSHVNNARALKPPRIESTD